MASDRLCGYCRAVGHRKPDCPTFLEHRNTILTHTPAQRKRLIEAMGELGLGIGAMLKTTEAWTGAECITVFQSFDWVVNCNFVSAVNVKYSKRVKLQQLFVDTNFEHRPVHANVLRMGDGKAEQRNMSIYVTEELRKLKENNGKLGNKAISMWSRDSHELVSPSHEIDYDPEILVKDVAMPTRLLLSDEHSYSIRGIMP